MLIYGIALIFVWFAFEKTTIKYKINVIAVCKIKLKTS